MSVKSISTRISIVGRGAKCSGGSSAVEKSSYISRTTLECEYNGQTYYPKYSEDLVHSEIMLPENAPPEYMDRSVLWNSVEMFEQNNARAQLARSMRIVLPNDWSYEVAIEVMKEYVKENFVDKGMCCEWAIHDSEHNGQRNLHCHVLLTMRPILADGTWGEKQKKVYLLDKDGNKIIGRNGKPKCTTKDVTGWNDRGNAKMWRANLRELINATNEKLKIDETWDERSFKERGLDIEPTIHLGPKASALERAGIATERGNINRDIRKHNSLLMQAKAVLVEAVERVEQLKLAKPIVAVVNEVVELINKITAKKGRLDLPIVGGKYLAKMSDRKALQSAENATAFTVEKGIDTFEALEEYKQEHEQRFDAISSERTEQLAELEHLEELTEIYSEYKPLLEIKKQSDGLKGLSKKRFDKEHASELRDYGPCLARLKDALEGAKATPSAWQKRIAELKDSLAKSRPQYGRLATDLAYAEVISYNKRNYEREQANERSARTHSHKKNREEVL